MPTLSEFLSGITIKELVLFFLTVAIIVFARDGRRFFGRRKDEEKK